MNLLQVIEEFQEHDPGEHGEAVQVSAQSLVFPHDIPRGLNEASQLLGSG
jgi:hypothetical protein